MSKQFLRKHEECLTTACVWKAKRLNKYHTTTETYLLSWKECVQWWLPKHWEVMSLTYIISSSAPGVCLESCLHLIFIWTLVCWTFSLVGHSLLLGESRPILPSWMGELEYLTLSIGCYGLCVHALDLFCFHSNLCCWLYPHYLALNRSLFLNYCTRCDSWWGFEGAPRKEERNSNL